MSAYTTVEMWLCVDAQGDYGQGPDQESAQEDYTNDIGPLESSNGFRLVRCRVRVPLPETCTVEVQGIAADVPPATPA